MKRRFGRGRPSRSPVVARLRRRKGRKIGESPVAQEQIATQPGRIGLVVRKRRVRKHLPVKPKHVEAKQRVPSKLKRTKEVAKRNVRPEGPAKPVLIPEEPKLVRGENVQVQQVAPPTPRIQEEATQEHLPVPGLNLTRRLETRARVAAPKLPAILFEGDDLPAEPMLQSCKPAGSVFGDSMKAENGATLNLIARDPQSIYAYWDLSREKQTHYNALSADKHMILLVWQTGAPRRLVSEMAVHPDSRHWFVHVPTPGASYCGELGYYNAKRQWITVAVSENISTPGGKPHLPSATTPPVFASVVIEPERPVVPVGTQNITRPEAFQTISIHPSEPRLAHEPVWNPSVPNVPYEPVSEPSPLEMEARNRIPFAPETYHELTIDEPVFRSVIPAEAMVQDEAPASPALPKSWGEAEAREILMIAGIADGTRRTEGSIEVVDILQRWLKKGVGISSIEALEFGLEAGPEQPVAISSPGVPGGLLPAELAEQAPGFWLNVNAELVIYGATEPDANVTIGGRRIRLRPDGSFSYRFSLPNGRYELPVRAVSSSGDVRGATLRFGRDTAYESEVGAHPQDPALKPPKAENIPQ